jgi:tRNA modification GTPase
VRAVTVEGGRRVEWIDLAGTFTLEGLFAAGGGTLGDSPAAGAGAFGGESGADDSIWEVVRRLTRRELTAADKILWVLDATVPLEPALLEFRRLPSARKLLVVQKIDLLEPEVLVRFRSLPEEPLLVSAHRRLGIGELIDRVTSGGSAIRAERARSAGAPPLFLLSSHQDTALSLAEEALSLAREALSGGLGFEYVASDLRDALRALEDLTGKVTPDVILEHVFSRFCVGK